LIARTKFYFFAAKPELYCDRSSIRASVDDRLYLELNGNNSTAYFYIGTSDSKPTPSCKATGM